MGTFIAYCCALFLSQGKVESVFIAGIRPTMNENLYNSGNWLRGREVRIKTFEIL